MDYKSEKIYDINTENDPVRPELTEEFRTSPGREVFGLKDDNGELAAIICLAYTKMVPKTVQELDTFTHQFGDVAIPYTVWSHVKGAGKTIINRILEYARNSKNIKRVITLSPLTETAKRFHLKNGAKQLQVNEMTQNFEYNIENKMLEEQIEKIKEWFKLDI